MNMNSPVRTSEQYHAQALRWSDLDGKARSLEQLQEHELNKRAKAYKDMSVAAAEREVKASQEWADYITEKVQARTSANDARAEMDTLAMRHAEEMRRV